MDYRQCIREISNFPKKGIIFKDIIPIRKQGKLPGQVIQADYELEYGTNTLEMQKDAFAPGSKILIVDDLLATGGTIKASIELVEKLQGIVQGLAFILELNFLNGRHQLREYPIITLMRD